MSKPRIYGAASGFVPNSQRDRRCHPKAFLRNKALADTSGDRKYEKREGAQDKELSQRLKTEQ